MRGQASSIGDTRTAPNGYHYTRTSTGWTLTHRITAEQKLGRSLRENERIRFADNDRNNYLDPDNIIVYEKSAGTKAKRLAVIDARIADLQAMRKELVADGEG